MGSTHRISAATGSEGRAIQTASCPVQSGPASACRQPQATRRSACLALGLLGLHAGGWAAAQTATTAAAGARSSPSATSFYANFQGLKLLDQDGKRLRIEPLAQRIVLVNFVYTGCSTTCPMQTRALTELQRQLPPPLRQRLHLLSISLDPLGDTPQALRAFATRMGVDLAGWTFATGRPDDVDKLAEALRLFRPGTDTRKLEDHSTAIWLVDAQGQLRMRYAGNPPDVPRLLREIAALEKLNPDTPPRKS